MASICPSRVESPCPLHILMCFNLIRYLFKPRANKHLCTFHASIKISLNHLFLVYVSPSHDTARDLLRNLLAVRPSHPLRAEVASTASLDHSS